MSAAGAVGDPFFQGKMIRWDAILDLDRAIEAMGPIGLAVLGSAAEQRAFLPGSDLDVAPVDADPEYALWFAGELEARWRAERPHHPPLDVTVLPGPPRPDPAYRASLWLGPPDPVARAGIRKALARPEVARAHALEAFCEHHAAHRGATPRTEPDPRTHPSGLRCLWELRHLSGGALRARWWVGKDWLPGVLVGLGLPRMRAADAARAARRLRRARMAQGPAQGPAVRRALAVLEAVVGDALVRGIERHGLDPAALFALLDLPEEERIERGRADPDAAVLLAWCDGSARVLGSLFAAPPESEAAAMGLAFNRATPAGIVVALTDSPDFATGRPRLRRRCYTHRALDGLPGPQRAAFLGRCLAGERLPKLRKLLDEESWR